ncbi:MAG: hypothetical protein IPH54_21500 [Rhodoferax sp.]|nr:hypothetical protein [Rhodoferax sp.]
MFLIDVTRVQALPNRNLDLTFENGFHGIVEMDRIVKNYTGVLPHCCKTIISGKSRSTPNLAP